MKESKKEEVMERQESRCNICNKENDGSFELDHIEPNVLSYDNSIENLQYLCKNCHKEKTKKDRRKIIRVRKRKIEEEYEKTGICKHDKSKTLYYYDKKTRWSKTNLKMCTRCWKLIRIKTLIEVLG